MGKTEIFYLDENLFPITVSVVHRMLFQKRANCGKSIYNWVDEKDGYTWWIKRFEYSFKLFDIIVLTILEVLNLIGK